MKTFERAILMPAEAQNNLETKKYPEYGAFLMENPFPKKKKKKKGKKGKKRWSADQPRKERPRNPLTTTNAR